MNLNNLFVYGVTTNIYCTPMHISSAMYFMQGFPF